MFKTLKLKHPELFELLRIAAVIVSSLLYAFNLRCFAKTAGLLPGGFAGISLLIQNIMSVYFNINVPYTLLNVFLNIFPVYIGFRFIGKKFTLYSIIHIVLSSIFVDILPSYSFTEDSIIPLMTDKKQEDILL